MHGIYSICIFLCVWKAFRTYWGNPTSYPHKYILPTVIYMFNLAYAQQSQKLQV